MTASYSSISRFFKYFALINFTHRASTCASRKEAAHAHIARLSISPIESLSTCAYSMLVNFNITRSTHNGGLTICARFHAAHAHIVRFCPSKESITRSFTCAYSMLANFTYKEYYASNT